MAAHCASVRSLGRAFGFIYPLSESELQYAESSSLKGEILTDSFPQSPACKNQPPVNQSPSALPRTFLLHLTRTRAKYGQIGEELPLCPG